MTTVGGMGSPTVGMERIGRGDECVARHAGAGKPPGTPLHPRHSRRDRRLQFDAPHDRGRPDRSPGDRWRRHGPRLSRAADGHLQHLRRGADPRRPRRSSRARGPLRPHLRPGHAGALRSRRDDSNGRRRRLRLPADDRAEEVRRTAIPARVTPGDRDRPRRARGARRARQPR